MSSAAESDPWLRRFRPCSNPALRLVCFPHAGGSASSYHALAKAMDHKCDVLAVQYPGRQDRRSESCVESISELADRVVARVVPLLDKPMALFGHSMGALVAFEVARRLECRGVLPRVLFVSGRRSPSSLRAESVHLLEDAAFMRKVKSLGGFDDRILNDDEMLGLVLPVIRNDYRVVETYRFDQGPPLATPIHACMGLSDPEVTVGEAEDWRSCTTGKFELELFSGGHFYLMDQLDELIDSISSVLFSGGTCRSVRGRGR
ncbi:thioesterase II family protein [Nocardia terpenica]|uniref:Thioesterase TesA n=1 Tax=Nocardia terpenica TaxID=455432 RepID=A0A6G9Z968_9NOCA|nr:alpha/beta fold hydrolase [Nocardia terpenica]QIS22135.1 alpha/beta fold hydrolase [Nocardia terpenica]